MRILNRWSVVLLGVGLLIGYSASGRTVEARQNGPFPFTVGDRISLEYSNAVRLNGLSTFECVVVEVIGRFVHCEQKVQFRPDQGGEQWLNLKDVVRIVKREK